MRISTSQIFDQNLASMLNQQSQLAKTQNQLSSGQRIQSPSEDPAGAVKALNLQRAFNLAEQYQANANVAITRLGQEETALDGAADIMQRIRELAVQGLNASNSQPDRQAIAAEMRQLNQQLLSAANSKDEKGDYLFAGFANSTQPYNSLLGTYQGDEGQRFLKVGDGVLIETNDPANKVFEAPLISTTITPGGGNGGNAVLSVSDTSNSADQFAALTFTFDAVTQQFTVTDGTNSETFTYRSGENINLGQLNGAFPSIQVQFNGTPDTGDSFVIEKQVVEQSQTLFKTIDDFANALQNNSVGPNDSPNNGDFLTNINAALGNIIDTRSLVGGRINAIDTQLEINDTLAFNIEKSLSEIQDLDFAEAISLLTRQSIGLQAAQQSFAQVQRLSLFNFL